MSYIDDIAEKIKISEIEDYDFSSQELIPELWELFLQVRKCIQIKNDPSFVPFIYFEKTAGASKILSFRMPETDSYLIYRCKVRPINNREKYFVSVLDLKGPESQAYFEASARLVIPFFKAVDERLSNIPYLATKCTIDMRTGKYRRKDYTLEELEQGRIASEENNSKGTI